MAAVMVVRGGETTAKTSVAVHQPIAPAALRYCYHQPTLPHRHHFQRYRKRAPEQDRTVGLNEPERHRHQHRLMPEPVATVVAADSIEPVAAGVNAPTPEPEPAQGLEQPKHRLFHSTAPARLKRIAMGVVETVRTAVHHWPERLLPFVPALIIGNRHSSQNRQPERPTIVLSGGGVVRAPKIAPTNRGVSRRRLRLMILPPRLRLAVVETAERLIHPNRAMRDHPHRPDSSSPNFLVKSLASWLHPIPILHLFAFA